MDSKKTLDLADIMKGVRNESSAWNDAKYQYETVRDIPYTEISRRPIDKMSLNRVLENTLNFLKDWASSGVNNLAQDVFTLDYELRGALDQPVMYRPGCMSLSFKVGWDVNNVKVVFYVGNLDDVIIPGELNSMVMEGKVRDLNKFAQYTSLSFKDVRDRKTQEISKILNIISAGVAGQNKLTRLVKGCLLYLDRLEHGDVTYTSPRFRKVEYDVKSLLDTMGFDNSAYVFVSDDNSVSYPAIMYACCEKYPNPRLGGASHIEIPADAEEIHLVSHGGHSGGVRTYVSASLIWGSLVRYCEEFCLGDLLEEALAIACSLRMNRYLTTVSLPAVVSGCDLVYPMLQKTHKGVRTKTWVNFETAKILGRVHQMMCLNMFKDVDTCAANSSMIKQNLNRNVRSILARDRYKFVEYMEDKCASGILALASQMVWTDKLNEAGMEHIRSFSVFEGFWLVKYPREALRDGIIMCLKKGYKHGLGIQRPGVYVDSYSSLIKEIVLGGGEGSIDLVDGGYNVTFSNVRAKDKIRVRKRLSRRSFVKSEVEKDPNIPEGECLPIGGVRFTGSIGWEHDPNTDEGFTTSRKQLQVVEPKVDELKKPLSMILEEEDEEVLSREVAKLENKKEMEMKRMEDKLAVIEMEYLRKQKELVDLKERHQQEIEELGALRKGHDRNEACKEVKPTNRKDKPDEGDGGGDVVRRPGPLIIRESTQEVRVKDTATTSGTRKGKEVVEMEVGDVIIEDIPYDAEPEVEAEFEEVVVTRTVVAEPSVEVAIRAEAGKEEITGEEVLEEQVITPKLTDVKTLEPKPVTPIVTKEKLVPFEFTPRGVMEEDERAVSKYKSPAARGSATTPARKKEKEKEKDLSECGLLELEYLPAKDFVPDDIMLGPVCRNWQGYLSMVHSSVIDKLTVGEFRTNRIARNQLLEAVDWWDNHDAVRVEDYPAVYHELVNDIRYSIEELEKVRSKARADLPNIIEGTVDKVKWMALQSSDGVPPSGITHINQLKGINIRLVDRMWWRMEARRFFGMRSDSMRVVSGREYLWFATYLDSGGNPEHWPKLWRMCNNCRVLETMEWHRVSSNLSEIDARRQRMKRSGASTQVDREALREKLKTSDSFTNFGGREALVPKRQFNSFVDMASEMYIGKILIALAQLAVTNTPIMEKYKYWILAKMVILCDHGDRVDIQRALGEEYRLYV